MILRELEVNPAWIRRRPSLFLDIDRIDRRQELSNQDAKQLEPGSAEGSRFWVHSGSEKGRG